MNTGKVNFLPNSKLCYEVALLLLYFVIGIYTISFVFLSTGFLDISSIHLLGVPIVSLLLFVSVFLKNENRKQFMIGFLWSFVILFLIALINLWVYDFSFDGQGYHQDAVLTISNSWNYFCEMDSQSYHNRWIDHYPKAHWLTASFYYNLSGNMSLGKMPNLILIITSFFLCIHLLKDFISSKIAILIIAFLAAFDPVNFNSFYSYMNDGQVSSVLLILLLLMVIHFREPSKINLIFMGLTLIYGINLKFNAALYCLGLVAFFLAFIGVSKDYKYFKQLLVTSFATIVLGFCLFGKNPYINNFKNQGNMFYPLLGKVASSKELGVDYLPSNMVGKPYPQKVLQSTFSITSFSKSFGKIASKKWPFTIQSEELKTYAGTGVMLGGLGPWFSGLWLFCLLLLLPIIYALRKKKLYLLSYMLALSYILATVFLNPLGWWFRFVPQYWFWIVATLIILFSINKHWARFSRSILLVLMIGNFALMGAYPIYQVYASHQMDQRLEEIKVERDNKRWSLDFGQHALSFQYKLDKRNIPYEIINCKEVVCDDQKIFKLLDVKSKSQ